MSAFRAPVPAVESGQLATFRLSKLPAGWTRLPYLDVVPSGGVGVPTALTGFSIGAIGSAAYVAEGTGAGLWVQYSGKVVCINIQTGVGVGVETSLPAAYAGNVSAFVTAGKDIYLCIAGSSRLYKFDTETRIFTRLADFPRVLGSGSHGLLLKDGRIVFTCSVATGLTVSPGAVPFWIYNPKTGGTPVEVSIAVPLTKVQTTSSRVPRIVLLPSGRLLMWDFANPTEGNRKSCVLTVVGDSIFSGPAEDTGFASTTPWGAMTTSTGVLLDTNTANRWASYSEGSGWVTAPPPCALGTFSIGYSNGGYALSAPGLGYVGLQPENGSTYSLFFTGTTDHGDPLVQAIKD